MAKSKAKKQAKLDEAEAYQPWIEAVIPAEARIFPYAEASETPFPALLEETRAVFDPKQMLINITDEASKA